MKTDKKSSEWLITHTNKLLILYIYPKLYESENSEAAKLIRVVNLLLQS